METRRIFELVVVVLALGSLSVVGAEQAGSGIGGPVEIDSGSVIVEGHYLPPPYALRAEDGKTFINGIDLSPPRDRGSVGGWRALHRPDYQVGHFQLDVHVNRNWRRARQHPRGEVESEDAICMSARA